MKPTYWTDPVFSGLKNLTIMMEKPGDGNCSIWKMPGIYTLIAAILAGIITAGMAISSEKRSWRAEKRAADAHTRAKDKETAEEKRADAKEKREKAKERREGAKEERDIEKHIGKSC